MPSTAASTRKRFASAIEGARAGGAGEVLVNDSHGPMRNLLFDDLPAGIRVIFGNRKPFSMVQDSDGGFDGAFFVGYHGAAGDADAVLCHTYTPSVIYELRLNGIRCSEATINAALLGYFGVPVLFASGDRATVEGIQRRCRGYAARSSKDSIGNFGGDSLLPAAARRLIAAKRKPPSRDAAGARPFAFEPPDQTRRQLVTAAQAHLVATIPGFERTGSRSVSFTHDDFQSYSRLSSPPGAWAQWHQAARTLAGVAPAPSAKKAP